jgi:hypothetical protein
MPTAPAGPREDLLGRLLHGEDQPPQPPPQLGDAQRGRRPCRALNPARVLRSWAGSRLFFYRCTTHARQRLFSQETPAGRPAGGWDPEGQTDSTHEPPTGPPGRHAGALLPCRARGSCLAAPRAGARPQAAGARAPRAARAGGEPCAGRRAWGVCTTSGGRSSRPRRRRGPARLARWAGGGRPSGGTALPRPRVAHPASRPPPARSDALARQPRGRLAGRRWSRLGDPRSTASSRTHGAVAHGGPPRPRQCWGTTGNPRGHARPVARWGFRPWLRGQAAAGQCHA